MTHNPEIINSVVQLNPRTMGIALPVLGIGVITTLVGLGYVDFQIMGIGFIFLLVGIPLLLCVEKIAIDKPSQTIRIYYDYFLFKIGKPKIVNSYLRVVIFYSSSSNPAGRHLYGTSTHFYGTSSRSYEVFLIGKNKLPILVHEFDNHGKAKRLQEKIAEGLGLDFEKELIIKLSPVKYTQML